MDSFEQIEQKVQQLKEKRLNLRTANVEEVIDCLGDDFFNSLFINIDKVLSDSKYITHFEKYNDIKTFFFHIPGCELNIENVKKDDFKLNLDAAISHKVYEYIKSKKEKVKSVHLQEIPGLYFLDRAWIKNGWTYNPIGAIYNWLIPENKLSVTVDISGSVTFYC